MVDSVCANTNFTRRIPMNETQVTTILGRARATLDEQEITDLGRLSGFTKRRRTITPQRLAVSLLTVFSTQRVETIADLVRGFNAITGRSVAYKPFHNQLAKATFPRFMKTLFHRLVKK